MKKRFIATIAIFIFLFPGVAFMAAADGNDGEDLVIEIPQIQANPGEIIDVPVLVTSSPGVSVIKDLRIGLSRGLNLFFPQGKDSYDNTGTVLTWPFEPGNTTLGRGEGVLPVMGRPTAANISDSHIVLNFLDISLPYDSSATGTLVTLKVAVDEAAAGKIQITLSGGMYSNLALERDKEPVLINGIVDTGIDDGSGSQDDGSGGTDNTTDDSDNPSGNTSDGNTSDGDTTETSDSNTNNDGTGPQNPANPANPAIPPRPIPRSTVINALEEDEPHIMITPDSGTLLSPDLIEEIIKADKPITFEYPDGEIIVIEPAEIPATDTDFDVLDLHPDPQYKTQYYSSRENTSSGGSPFAEIILLPLAGLAVIAATIVIVSLKLSKDKQENDKAA